MGPASMLPLWLRLKIGSRVNAATMQVQNRILKNAITMHFVWHVSAKVHLSLVPDAPDTKFKFSNQVSVPRQPSYRYQTRYCGYMINSVYTLATCLLDRLRLLVVVIWYLIRMGQQLRDRSAQ